MRKLLCVVVAIALSGCAGHTVTTPGPVTTVLVPTPVACSVSPGPKPVFVDTPEALKAAPDILEQVKLLLGGRLQRMGWEGQLSAANTGCRTAPATGVAP